MEELVIQDGILKSCSSKEPTVVVPDGVHTIGEGAFKGCISIETVLLPDTVTVISDNAFKGCRRLMQIKLPSSLKTVGSYAFHRCHMLQSISLPDGVKELGNCVFLYCDSLEEVSMPGVRSLGKQVFLNDVSLKKLHISRELSISCICDVFTGCGKLEEVILTDTVYSLKNAVSLISAEADIPPLIRTIAVDIYRMMEIENQNVLKFLTNIRNVELPEGITGIGKSCFFDKKGIVSVKLPSTLRFIDSRAFRNCINLERVEFGYDDVSISPDAFKNCTTLKYIRLADGKEYALEGLEVPGGEVPPVVQTVHSQVLGNFCISGTTLLKYRGSEARVVVPDGIRVIGERAFAGNEAVDRVVLPASVVAIEERAFEDCLVLQTIDFPEGLSMLGKSAFENCVKLIRAILPESLIRLEVSAFNRCKALREVRFGRDMREIEDLAFYNCVSLQAVELPEGLLRIGDLAFYRCTSLKEVQLPSSLLSLGNQAFTMSGITRAVVRCVPTDCHDVFSQCAKLKKLILEEGVRHIGDKYAFHCERLSQIVLPASLETVGRNAFDGSPWFLSLPEDGTSGAVLVDGSHYQGDVRLPEHVRMIAGGAFCGNEQITSVTIPEEVTWIGPRAFCGCTGLLYVKLPSRIPVIPEGLFSYCPSLIQVELMQTETEGQLVRVEEQAFYDCRSLMSIPSLESADFIGKEALWGCGMLYNLELSCGDMGDRAFEGTGFLNELKARSPLAATASVLIDGLGSRGRVTIPEGIERIADYAFCGNKDITWIVFPESLKHIGAYGFAGCSSLEGVSFSSVLETLGSRAFEACGFSGTVSCPVRVIGDGAFSRCRSLKHGSFDRTEVIGSHGFEGCVDLESVSCAHLAELGSFAFSGCEALTAWDVQTVRCVGERAFYGCFSLKRLALYGEMAVGAHGFEDCTSLEVLRIPEEGFTFGTCCFSGCTALRRIVHGEGIYDFKSYGELFDQTIPSAVRQILCSVYSCFSIDEGRRLTAYYNAGRSVVIPDGVKRVEGEVFRNCAGLAQITVPESVEYIGPRAFHGTKWMDSESRQGMVIVNKFLLDASCCEGEVTIPAEVERISGWAFSNCFGLTGIVLVNDRIVIEEHAFRNCINIKQLILADGTEYRLERLSDREAELPSMVKQIWRDCFNCFKTDGQGCLTECTGNIANLNLPAGITFLGDGALQESNLLSTVTLTDETEGIGNSAFKQCKWLTQVKNAIHIRQIKAMAFSGCIRLQRIELGVHLTFLGVKAFENCTSLQELIIPEGVTEIPDQACFRCHELKRVMLPSTLRRIGKEAFAFCYCLEEVSLPDGLELIDSRAFAWCKSISLDRMSPETVCAADAFSFTPKGLMAYEV